MPEDKKRKVTMTDIANASGVSVASVSMILNEKQGVTFNAQTKAKVLHTAKQLGYIRQLETKRWSKIFGSKMIALISPNVSNPYYSTLIQSIEQVARARGYETILYNTYRDPKSETLILQTLSCLGVAGIIFTMQPSTLEEAETFSGHIPMVVIGDRNTALNVDTIEVNNYNAGILIAQHMQKLGHKHVAYISTTLATGPSPRTRRLEGIRTELKTDPEATLIVKCRNFTPKEELENLFIEYQVGYELTKECLDDKKLTAFVAVNDMVAYGVLDALQNEGLHVPEDYSVCGFDNIFPSGFHGISLTSVEHYIMDKGHNAAEILLSKIEHDSKNNITRVEYQHRLQARGTTAPPRTHVLPRHKK